MQRLAIQPFHLVTDNATSCNPALPVVSCQFFVSTLLHKLKSTTTQTKNSHNNTSCIRAYAHLQPSSPSLSLFLNLCNTCNPVQSEMSTSTLSLNLCNTCNPVQPGRSTHVHSKEFLNDSIPTTPNSSNYPTASHCRTPAAFC